jgi:protein-disulfide isomerase
VGGASRNERRRRQGAGQNVTAARRPDVGRIPGSKKDNRVKVGIAVAVVLVVLFAVVYVVLTRTSSTSQPAAASYPITADGVVVTAGRPDAPVTIDVYEDYLCPFCERFENRSGDDLTKALTDGKAKVNYHALNILDNRTAPPGYSTLAANAALCAVPADIWPAFHERLFAEQPAEGSAGLTAAELTSIGTKLGAGPDFGACVSANSNAAAITAASEAASATPALQTDGQFGTPTVAVGGKKIDVSSSDWLEGVLGGS